MFIQAQIHMPFGKRYTKRILSVLVFWENGFMVGRWTFVCCLISLGILAFSSFWLQQTCIRTWQTCTHSLGLSLPLKHTITFEYVVLYVVTGWWAMFIVASQFTLSISVSAFVFCRLAFDTTQCTHLFVILNLFSFIFHICSFHFCSLYTFSILNSHIYT